MGLPWWLLTPYLKQFEKSFGEKCFLRTDAAHRAEIEGRIPFLLHLWA